MKVYEVPDEIQPYVSSFLLEAGKRGHRLVIDDLIVTYKFDIITTQVHAAGLCRKRFGHTPIIYIDTTSSNWRASEMTKEQLVFHELCHCILGRGHTSDTLLNGNPASIMKPSGETLYGHIMSDFKREYYLDELFNPEAERPAWAQITETYNKPYEVTDTIYYESFEDPIAIDDLAEFTEDTFPVFDSLMYKKWSLGENTVTRREIQDGRLELQSFIKGTYLIPFNIDIPTDSNFEIRVNMAVPGGIDGLMSFYWGGNNVKNAFAFIANQNGYVSIGQLENGVVSAKYGMPIYNDIYNEILIRKIGNHYYFFINGRFLDNLLFVPFSGNLFGFGVSGKPSEVWVEDILVTTIKAVSR